MQVNSVVLHQDDLTLPFASEPPTSDTSRFITPGHIDMPEVPLQVPEG
jgi:hypothetical protein